MRGENTTYYRIRNEHVFVMSASTLRVYFFCSAARSEQFDGYNLKIFSATCLKEALERAL